MAVIHDYICAAHGGFTNRTGMCPHGCAKAMVQLTFNKAPGMVTARTRNIDNTLQGLAKDHGLTDMNNHGGTTGAFVMDPSVSKQDRELQQKMLAGRTYEGTMGENSVATTLASANLQGGNALNNPVVRSMIQPPRPNVVGSWSGKD